MERNQAIQIVREACIAANPEIQGEHVFETGYGRCKYCQVPRIVVDRKSILIKEDRDSGGSIREVSTTDYNQEGLPCPNLTRRPIHLADILVAIEGTEHEGLYSVGEGGWFYQDDLQSEGYENMDISWNLRASLAEQTTETLLFLAELVGKGKNI